MLGDSLTDVAALEKSFRAVFSSACISTPTVNSHLSSRGSAVFFGFLTPFDAFFCCLAASLRALRKGVSSCAGGWRAVCRLLAEDRVGACPEANGSCLARRKHDWHMYGRFDPAVNTLRVLLASIV